jgi:hypothetical protein
VKNEKQEENEFQPEKEEEEEEEQQQQEEEQVVVDGQAEDDASDGATDSDGALASVPLEASAMTNDSWGELASSTDDPNVSAHSHSTQIRSNSGNVDGARSFSEQVRTVDFDGDAFDADGNTSEDDTGSWTQIDAEGMPTERQEDGTSQLGPFDNEQSLRSRTAGAQQREGGQGEDWMRWVGGGLAVAGAVIGGIALANQNNNNNTDGKGQNNNQRAAAANSKKSNVTIELLDSDEER